MNRKFAQAVRKFLLLVIRIFPFLKNILANGTSEEELEALRVKGCMIAARKWLDYLRDGSWHNSLVSRVREEARRGNLSLADIGTSEEELEALRVKGCITAARNLLDHLRNGTNWYDWAIDCLREEARRGNLSLADIGTSEEELEALRIKGCMIAARKWLDHLRKGTDWPDWVIGCLREEAHRGNLSLADIGTSEEELESLKEAS